ncbi:alpha-amylase family glycosyl hydrolase [Actinoplanes sp. TRM 88003]|uniref:Alpha-amylase family glycosyl hydrolase n=1 Tax=Paractinoplanes aksuensis TaxID=2939490 RepID=A0ABT1DLV7_9ACTN|nr:alpha-amylase family glycosyl hydrolase [Actinoplanes aksuensis]MCO8271818.1 alpha-amylase family glycosyl hydrolase [Actinoplanes aksuensis]
MTAIYEINTWPWLAELGQESLADVPGEVWDELIGFDAVWLMGVWERSPAGLAIAAGNAGLQKDFHAALPDLSPADIVGSPYCVRNYVVDQNLGGPGALREARAQLKSRGLKLILDYVPNHVAPDHPAITEHPDWFINGTPRDLADDPGRWFAAGDRVIARGKDPYFPPWPDVAQLNAFHPGLRAATRDALRRIAEQCDGVRVDMAMLVFNDIFAGTWGDRAGERPAEEFWPSILAQLPDDFLLIAEAYWDTEFALQQQGFDLCYDKRLYDRLAHEDAAAVRGHLTAGLDYQNKLLRFIENHDEPRAATALPGPRGRAAAVAIATLPGSTLWHDGQFEGRRVKLPVFLGRFPDEPVDEGLRDFYDRLVVFKDAGQWQLLDTSDVLAWTWQGAGSRHLIVINFSDEQVWTRVRLPWSSTGKQWRLTDLLDGRVFDRDGADLDNGGLVVGLPAWGVHVLSVKS